MTNHKVSYLVCNFCKSPLTNDVYNRPYLTVSIDAHWATSDNLLGTGTVMLGNFCSETCAKKAVSERLKEMRSSIRTFPCFNWGDTEEGQKLWERWVNDKSNLDSWAAVEDKGEWEQT